MGIPSNDEIDTELYLRDGFPFVTVCKVQLKDGRIGIGVFRQELGQQGELGKDAADAAALADAMENVQDVFAARAERGIVSATRPLEHMTEPDLQADIAAGRAFTVTEEPDVDLQAQLGNPAHG